MRSIERAQKFLDSIDARDYAPAYVEMLAKVIDQAAAAEREACARIAETTYAKDAFHFELATAVAAAIRARAAQPSVSID